MNSPFSVVPLAPGLDHSGFHCGDTALDLYFKQQVNQDIKRKVTACFIATDSHARIAGYYTLASSSVLLTDLPDRLRKKLPRYPSVPAVRMGRLAVDIAYRGKGLGGALLVDAIRRAANAEIAAYALIVDAKNETAAAFYHHHGLTTFTGSPLTLFVPLTNLQSLKHHW